MRLRRTVPRTPLGNGQRRFPDGLDTVVTAASISGKPSTPWSPGAVQDFMHAKLVVCDDVSFVGSFNLSRSGERNAENVVEIRDKTIADTLAGYVDEVRALYPPATPPALRAPVAGAGVRRREENPAS